jgi:uncharacterized membrane protein
MSPASYGPASTRSISAINTGNYRLVYARRIKYLNHISAKTIWLNLMFLFSLSLVPSPTQALGKIFTGKKVYQTRRNLAR